MKMAKPIRYRGMTAGQLAEATKEYGAPNPNPKPFRVHSKVASAEHRIRTTLRKRGPGRLA